MSKLTRTQIMVVRTMGRQLTSLEKSLDKVHIKEAKFLADIEAEKVVILDAMDKINASIITYTGGLTFNEVINPLSSVGVVDPTATVDETELPTETDVTDLLISGQCNAKENLQDEASQAIIAEIPEGEVPVKPFWDTQAEK